MEELLWKQGIPGEIELWNQDIPMKDGLLAQQGIHDGSIHTTSICPQLFTNLETFSEYVSSFKRAQMHSHMFRCVWVDSDASEHV